MAAGSLQTIIGNGRDDRSAQPDMSRGILMARLGKGRATEHYAAAGDGFFSEASDVILTMQRKPIWLIDVSTGCA